jgi:hypothetical protein
VSCSRSRTRTGLAVRATALLPLGAAAPSAHADTPVRKLCVDEVTLRDSPSGYAVGYLHRPQKLSVLDESDGHRWVLVSTKRGLSGWIPKGALCRPSAK